MPYVPCNSKLKLYIPLESASGIPILKLLNGKTMHTIHHFFFFIKVLRRPWNEVTYQFIKICRLKIESI
jgi:hypothetical protein